MTDQPLAIVTGASGNLGTAVVTRLVADGLRVARVERSRIVLDGADPVDVDLSNGASTRTAFELVTRGTKLRAVVHTVGTFRAGTPLVDAADEEFSELFQTNVMTTLHVVQAALAIMLPQNSGRIAVVASLDALDAAPKRAAYGASKAAQLRLMESAAADVKATPITLNTVLPSTMDTPQNRAAMPKADPSKWLKLDEVANVLAYLVSDAASGIHGQAIRVERS
jgi:NAD(P)-dependent dehydrogenase (short-subunit alcohol dehydrogenase family)